jgi:hypothetical protein
MIIFNKKYFFSTIFIFSLITLLLVSSCHKGPGYNPYLHQHRANQRQARATKKINDDRTKNYKKQLRKNRRNLFGTPPPKVGRPGK